MSAQNSQAAGSTPVEVTIDLSGVDQLALLGGSDSNLRLLREKLSGAVTVRGDNMILQGSANQVDLLRRLVEDMIRRVQLGQSIDEVTLSYLWAQHSGEAAELVDEPTSASETLLFSGQTRRAVKAKTAGQRKYVEAIRQHDIVFSIGPAGTGKTFLAVVMAMDYLKRKLVDRIVLVRPAVEAGEQLGFLPGDLHEKINPYLRPLYDALADILGPSRITRYMSDGIIEAVPLAYMRGRTLNNAFVILDEAQNTTVGQMKMFLTRLGFQAKAVVTGDVTQIDLGHDQRSGLVQVREILFGMEGIAFVELDNRDVLRHPLVRRIVDAFAVAEEKMDGR